MKLASDISDKSRLANPEIDLPVSLDLISYSTVPTIPFKVFEAPLTC
jgi:hypothetical protein